MSTRENRLGEAVLTRTHNLCFEQKFEEKKKKKMLEFLSENFQFLLVKFSIYLNRRVFVMRQYQLRRRQRCFRTFCGQRSPKMRQISSVMQIILPFSSLIKRTSVSDVNHDFRISDPDRLLQHAYFIGLSLKCYSQLQQTTFNVIYLSFQRKKGLIFHANHLSR